MGDAFTWSIFGAIVLACFGVTLYSLLGQHRSPLIAIPVALVFLLSLVAVALGPRRLGIVLLVASGAGFVRQFRRPQEQP